MLRSFSSLKREGWEICQAGSQRSKRQDKWEGGGNSSCWKTNCSFTITIVGTEKQQQTRLPSWMRQSPITKSSYCVSDILHMMHVVMNNVAPPMGQTVYYWKWSSKHYRWDVWIPLDMISIEPMITEVTCEKRSLQQTQRRDDTGGGSSDFCCECVQTGLLTLCCACLGGTISGLTEMWL